MCEDSVKNKLRASSDAWATMCGPIFTVPHSHSRVGQKHTLSPTSHATILGIVPIGNPLRVGSLSMSLSLFLSLPLSLSLSLSLDVCVCVCVCVCVYVCVVGPVPLAPSGTHWQQKEKSVKVWLLFSWTSVCVCVCVCFAHHIPAHGGRAFAHGRKKSTLEKNNGNDKNEDRRKKKQEPQRSLGEPHPATCLQLATSTVDDHSSSFPPSLLPSFPSPFPFSSFIVTFCSR